MFAYIIKLSIFMTSEDHGAKAKLFFPCHCNNTCNSYKQNNGFIISKCRSLIYLLVKNISYIKLFTGKIRYSIEETEG